MAIMTESDGLAWWYLDLGLAPRRRRFKTDVLLYIIPGRLIIQLFKITVDGAKMFIYT